MLSPTYGAYLFDNRRANRMKVLVHDGLGIWLAACRLHQGELFWPGSALLTDGVGYRTAACPGAGVALAKSRPRRRDFNHITPAMTTRTTHLSDQPIVGFGTL
ncbi:IS66 family insertion sequence element accessory protein TnpB [Pseudomonas sp. NFX224]|uniref:IS66 family insertion sequence element accessory protein TnpB n=1 Tax=Pseudomonas sp. NFX224 TaxID=3402862 RepID=UPI003AFA1834